VAVRRSSAARPSIPSAEENRFQVPRLNKDPVWSLRPWPIEIEVAGTVIEVPPMCATDWLCYLMQAEFDLDTILSEVLPDLEDLVYDEAIRLDQVYEVVMEIISCAAARPWWVALRLISVAKHQWDVLGPELLARGADANAQSLSGWLDVLLVSILGAMDPKKTTMFIMQLEAVPDLMKDPSKDAFDEMEMDPGAFLSLGG
jgi:hypothetical protein